MSTRYRLVFRGQLLPGLSPAQVALNLAELFRIDAAQAQRLMATPSTIKQDVDLATGNRYQEALAEAGLVTHLEAHSRETPPVPGSDWDGVERRQGPRRQRRDRREIHRGAAIQPDRRSGRGRRSTD